MKSRIKPIEEKDAPIILKPLYMGFKKIAGKVGTSLKVLAHRLRSPGSEIFSALPLKSPAKSNIACIF